MVQLRNTGRVLSVLLSLGVLVLAMSACGGSPSGSKGAKIEIVSPENGAMAFREQVLSVQSVAIDDDHGILKVELWVDGQIYRVDQAPTKEGLPVFSAVQPWTPGTIGGHSLTAKAETVDGRVSESEPILVIVNELPTATPRPTETPLPATLTPTVLSPSVTFTPAPPTATWTPISPSPSAIASPTPFFAPPIAQTPPAGYPAYPNQPGQPGYPAYPGQPGYPAYPGQPGYSPGQPGFPVPIPSVPDMPPVVMVLSPQEGARVAVGQEMSIRARASDDRGVMRVEFLIDGGVYHAYDAAGQIAVEVVTPWNPTTPGAHTVEVRAFDDAWQMGIPVRVPVYVDQFGPTLMPTGWPPNDTTPPTVYIVSPPSGQRVSSGQSIALVVSANDNVGVAGMELWADGGLVASESFPSFYQTRQWTPSWSSTVAGSHDLVARARDSVGNVGQSAPLSLLVQQSGPVIGGRLYFCSQQSGNMDIYSIRGDGSDLTQITESAFAETSPAVSRDGQMLAYEREGEIWVTQTTGAGATRLIANPNPTDAVSSPAWSPDRQRVAFVQNNQLWIYLYSGGSTQPLTSDGFIYDSPNYSPDGGRIICHSWQGSPDSSLYVLSAVDGSVVQSFTSHSGADNVPVYSPDGGRIAFVRTGGIDSGIYVMQSDGSAVTRVANQGWSPAWSPNGGHLAYVVPRGAQAELWVTNSDGSNAQRILGGISMERIAWGP